MAISRLPSAKRTMTRLCPLVGGAEREESRNRPASCPLSGGKPGHSLGGETFRRWGWIGAGGGYTTDMGMTLRSLKGKVFKNKSTGVLGNLF